MFQNDDDDDQKNCQEEKNYIFLPSQKVDQDANDKVTCLKISCNSIINLQNIMETSSTNEAQIYILSLLLYGKLVDQRIGQWRTHERMFHNFKTHFDWQESGLVDLIASPSRLRLSYGTHSMTFESIKLRFLSTQM